MGKTYYSNASWTKIPNSKDDHISFDHANYVCRALMHDYTNKPCSVRGYCTRTWVTDESGKEVTLADYEKEVASAEQ
jgi:hypothetical protein